MRLWCLAHSLAPRVHVSLLAYILCAAARQNNATLDTSAFFNKIFSYLVIFGKQYKKGVISAPPRCWSENDFCHSK